MLVVATNRPRRVVLHCMFVAITSSDSTLPVTITCSHDSFVKVRFVRESSSITVSCTITTGSKATSNDGPTMMACVCGSARSYATHLPINNGMNYHVSLHYGT